MKVEIVTNLFAPDELAGAALFSDLARYLSVRGHDLRVLCTFSYYPAWKRIPADEGVGVREETWQGIPIRRISMYIPSQPSGLKRLLSDASFLFSIIRYYRFGKWKPDVLLTASPMFSQCLAQRLIYPFDRIPRMIVVQDFVVDAALELGILKLPLIDKPLRFLERWAFRSASTISTISEPMKRKLHGIVGEGRRLVFIPNWIHQSIAEETERQRGEVGRRPRVLLYSGNLGVKQGLPRFLKAFREINDVGWNLEIHGGGAERERLEQEVKSDPKVSLGGVLEERDYVQKLLSCSACLVTQMPGVGANFLPSKLLPALAAGTPVLAVCDPESPLGAEVLAGGFGEVVEPDDVNALRAVLQRWETRPDVLVEFGRRARQWGQRYERERVLSQYENELLRLVGE